MTALRDWAAGVRTTHRASAQVVADLQGERALDRASRRVSAERQRLASALHDHVSPLLFAMAARARRAAERPEASPDELREALRALTEELEEAQCRLRGVITEAGPASPVETVPTATQRDLDDFTERTGAGTHLLLQGHPEHLPPAMERVALSCLRQALFNIERHAKASLVVVTLDYQPHLFTLVVQDDGRGLPEGFEPRVVPANGHHWGFTSMAEKVERIGGSVVLRPLDEGGTQLRVTLPRWTGAQ